MHKPFSPWFLALAALAFAYAPTRAQQPGTATAPAAQQLAQEGWKLTPPSELYAIAKVVDADTIHVQRNGELQKLRLLSVDTEETFATNSSDPEKPSTVFGDECAKWAQGYFAALASDGQPPRVGLAFPAGAEQRDVYGRVLCYVILPDGRNFNLLLVQLGKSPYFNKYGNSELCHDAFVASQKRAREQQLGIWSPATNTPKSPGAPSAKRPYERLLPWWDARAAAVDSFRERRAKDPLHTAAADAPAELATALECSKKGEQVALFGSIDKLFDEDDGSWTVLLRTGAKDKAVRVRIPKAARAGFEKLDLAHLSDDYRQNYLWIEGTLGPDPRGFELRCDSPARFKLAGPEPASASGGH